MKIIPRLFFLIIFINLRILAQSFTASVNNTTVGLDENFEVSFTFSGEDVNKLKNFRPPDFNHFIILSGPNYSTNMQIINGAVSASQSQNFIIKAREVGQFTIGIATIDYAGTTFKTQPLTITVTKGSTSGKTQTQDSGVNTDEIAQNVFVRAIPDKNKVYKGEQVIVTFKLYSRLSFMGINASKVSQQEGFWTEDLQVDPKASAGIEVYEGKKYQVYTITKIAVFPTKTGELTITPYEFKIPVIIQKKRKGNGSLFDDFFNDPFFNRNEAYEFNTKSNKVTITSLPLPENNVPESFKGAVGDFSLYSDMGKTQTKTNDPVTLKVEISGTGNIALLNIPELKLPSGFETYEPKSTDDITRSARISGKKTIDYLIIPRTTGKKEIPPVEFTYFSPLKKQYVTLKTPSYSINVEQGENVVSQNYSGKEEIRLLSDDIRYIKTSGSDIRLKSGVVLYQPYFWVMSVLPLFLFAGVVIWRKRDEKLSANIELLKYQRAEKVARNRFKTARKFLDKNEQVNFYSEISQALFGYLEDKFHIPKAEFSLDRASDEMRKRNMDEEIISRMKSYAEKCEYFRFAPHNDGITGMEDMYSGMTSVIVEIEKSLGRGKNGK